MEFTFDQWKPHLPQIIYAIEKLSTENKKIYLQYLDFFNTLFENKKYHIDRDLKPTLDFYDSFDDESKKEIASCFNEIILVLTKDRLVNIWPYHIFDFYCNANTDEKKIEYLKSNLNLIHFIKNPSEAVQLEAGSKGVFSDEMTKAPCDNLLRLLAKRYKGTLYRFNIPEHLQIEFAKTNQKALYYIKNLSERAQMTAVKYNPQSKRFIRDMYPSVYQYIKEFTKR